MAHIFVTTPDKWELLTEHNQAWPIKEKMIGKFASLKAKDEVIVYLAKQSAIAGIIQVMELPQKACVEFSDDDYQYSLPIKYKIVLKEKLVPMKPIVWNLEYAKNLHTNRWGALFQRTIIKIPEVDFITLKQYIIDARDKEIQLKSCINNKHLQG